MESRVDPCGAGAIAHIACDPADLAGDGTKLVPSADGVRRLRRAALSSARHQTREMGGIVTAILTSSGHSAIPWTIRGLASVVFIAASLVARPAAAEPPDAFDQRIAAELEALSPEAARTFEQANQARDRQDWEGARALYEDVRKLAPSFDHGTRRLCSVEASLGRHPQALAHCREALAAARTSQNLSALALTLTRASSTPADLQEANQLSAEAVALAPADKHVRRADCQLALVTADAPRLRACVSRLHIIAPDDSATDVFDALLAMLEQRRDDAYESLKKARSHGLPQEEHARLTDLFDRSVAWPVRVWNVAWRVGQPNDDGRGIRLGQGCGAATHSQPRPYR